MTNTNIDVWFDEDEQCYVAAVHEIDGCCVMAETPEEAIELVSAKVKELPADAQKRS